MSRFSNVFFMLVGLTVACAAKEPLSLSVVRASSRAASVSIPEEEGVRIERCARVDVVVDIESSLDQVLSYSSSSNAIYFVTNLEPIYAGSHAMVDSIRKTLLYAVTPEGPLPAARSRRTFSFLVFYLGESSLNFRVRLSVPNRKPGIDLFSADFEIDLGKTHNQSLEPTTAAVMIPATPGVAPAGVVAHL